MIIHIFLAVILLALSPVLGMEQQALNNELIAKHIYEPFIVAIKEDDQARVKQLVAQGADVNFDLTEIVGVPKMSSLLSWADHFKRPEIFCFLLDAGVDPLLDKRALRNRSPRFRRLLLKHVPQPLIRNTWNAITATILLCLKYKRPSACKGVREIIRDYCVMFVALEHLSDRRKVLCMDLDAIAQEENKDRCWANFGLEYDPDDATEWKPVWKEQIMHEIKNRPILKLKSQQQQKL